jgi:hypothetical protein
MAHLGFYLTNHQNKTVEMPVAPAEFSFTNTRDNKTTQVLKLGQINEIGTKDLHDFTFDLLIPVHLKVSYVTAQKVLGSARAYLDFIGGWQDSKKPGKLVITDLNYSFPVTVEDFTINMKDGNSNEYVVNLKLREWRDYSAKKVSIKEVNNTYITPAPGGVRPAPPATGGGGGGGLGVGRTVIVNGQLHRDSYGSGPGLTERNATRRISIVANGRPFPYHVTTLEGGWRGWVSADAVRAI